MQISAILLGTMEHNWAQWSIMGHNREIFGALLKSIIGNSKSIIGSGLQLIGCLNYVLDDHEQLEEAIGIPVTLAHIMTF